MVYGSLSTISFLLFLKSYGVLAQCPGRVELLPPASNIPSTAYIQPIGQVCFPAVIQIQEPAPQSPPQPSAPQDDDDDYLNLIYLLISALTGSNKGKCNSNSNNNGRNNNQNIPNPSFNPFTPIPTNQPSNGPKNPTPNNGYIDITSLINGPISCSSPNNLGSNNPSPITISIDTSGATTGCLCESCNCNNPFGSLNPFPGIIPGVGNGPSSGQNYVPASGYIPDSYNAGNGCIYVPYPVPVPYNVPGYGFDNICYPENEYPQEINLIIKTECD